MQLSDFDFNLPEELIARYPLPERSASRLLVLNRQTGAITHHQFRDLPELLQPHDLLVFNNSKVIPARLFGTKTTGGKVEILIERILKKQHVLAHVKTSKKLQPGAIIQLDQNYQIEMVVKNNDLYELKFLTQESVFSILEKIGHMPLPSYMQRNDEILDRERYQTIYAEAPGSVAAPTAGLHFDATLFQELAKKNIEETYITLHVGAGTFQPVRTETITEHKIHTENVEVTETACEAIKECQQQKGKIVAVGTTSVRSLETAAQSGTIHPFSGETDIFIYPGYQFHCADAIITNFHLPKSSLLMLVSAFAGHKNVMNAYQISIQEQYRFYSYGDAMLII